MASFILFAAGEGNASDDSTPNLKTKVENRSQTVLIAEDEGLVAINMEMALEEGGFRVVGIADTERDAAEMASRLKPDVVLMDITLRQGNGISAAQTILTSLKTRIVFISGNSDPATLAAAAKVAGTGFIRKPFVSERLASLVRNALNQH